MNVRLAHGLVLVPLLLGGLAGCRGGTCKAGGRTYHEDETWTCEDGCNSCSCGEDDTIHSTTIACTAPPGPAAGKIQCEGSDGTSHRHGERWDCGKGCCSCDDGETATTASACPDAGS